MTRSEILLVAVTAAGSISVAAAAQSRMEAAAPAAAPAAVRAAPAAADFRVDQAAVERAFQLIAAEGFSGAIAIRHNGREVFARAVGEAAPGRPFRTDTLNDTASIAKAMTTMALMKLMAEGRVSLDDPLSRWFPDAPADKAAITLRQLLRHESGISNFVARVGDYTPRTADEMARGLLAEPLAFAPGTSSAYSNGGFNLAGMIVERAAGMPLDEYMRREVFVPAGVAGSYDPARFPETLVAQGRLNGRAIDPDTGDIRPAPGQIGWFDVGSAADARRGPFWAVYGAGGIFMSATDLAKLMEAYAAGRIVGLEHVRQSFTTAGGPSAGGTGERQALAWSVIDVPGTPTFLYANGGAPHTANDLRYFPELGLTIAVVSNDRSRHAQFAARAVSRALFGGEMPDPIFEEMPGPGASPGGQPSRGGRMIRRPGGQPSGSEAVGAPAGGQPPNGGGETLRTPRDEASSRATAPPERVVGPGERMRALTEAADILEARYVHEDVAARLAGALRTRAADLAAAGDDGAFLDRANGLLYELSRDRHLRLLPREAAAQGGEGRVIRRALPAGSPDGLQAPVVSAESQDEDRPVSVESRWAARGVGYIRPSLLLWNRTSIPQFERAFAELGAADSIILDLRGVPGGTPLAVLQLASRFFEEPVPFSLSLQRGREPLERRTFRVPNGFGNRAQLFILIDESTFSAAESLAFGLQNRGRAALVGETTGGGGHFGGVVPLPGGYGLFVPGGVTVDPVTRRGWEQTGVVPDVPAPAKDALERALELARGARAREARRTI